MRRSTTGTRAWGGAALVWAAVAALLPWLRYGAPTPRWDVLTALGGALLCGLGWVAATWRAPRFVPAPPEDRRADGAPRLPARLPRPPLASLARGLAYALAGYALVSALLLAWQPDGRQARTLAVLQDAGATVSTGRITDVTSREQAIGGSSGKRSSYWYASFTAELSDGTRLSVDRGIVVSTPSGWRKVKVLHVPGRPELGGWADDSTDLMAYVQTWRPPLSPVPGLLTAFAAVATLAYLGRHSGRFGPHRLLAEDAAAGRVKAFRVDTLTAVRDEHTTVGFRAGTTRVVVRRNLRASGERGKLRLYVPEDADKAALAADFGASGGWLVWANRWRLVRKNMFVPCFFIASDGRIFRCTAYTSDLARLRERGVASEQSTDPSVTVRDWTGLCGTSPAVRLLLVLLYTAVAACALPALTGTASHLTGYLPLPAAGVAAVVAGYLVMRPVATDDLPVWERRRSRDRRVRAEA